MNKITLELPGGNTGTSYDIFVGSGILNTLGEKIASVFSGDMPAKAGIITDADVADLYLEETSRSLESQGIKVWNYVFRPGDSSKNMDTLNDILCGLAESGFDRGDVLVGLGGGVAGDMTGFAAAVFMRGMAYVQVPTTLLAAIDSSIGGKTAVNLRSGKNLAGAFWQPKLVLCDIDTLKTLPEEVYREGLAEAVKYGVIAERSLFEAIRKAAETGTAQIASDPLLQEEIIRRCIGIKCALVAEDQWDYGNRMLLNFGHTIGHAIEKISEYRITHGQAVAMGMVAESRAAYAMSYCPEDLSDILEELLGELGFDTSLTGFDRNVICRTVLMDKKWRGEGITIVVPETIGTCRLKKISAEALKQYVDKIQAPEEDTKEII